jgi:hypothetical protein
MATGLPTLSQIHAWDVDHLIEAAEHWHSTADRWESVYGQVWQQRRPIIGEIRSEDDLRRLWDWATEGAAERAPGSTYKGTERVLRDGTIVGLRPSDSGLTLDFNPPDGPYEKIHVNTARGGIPDIPVRAAGPPEEIAPRAHAPVESAPVESAPVEPAPPRPAPVAPQPSPPIGPPGSNPLPHFIESPHFHRGPPIVGRDDLGELPE